MERGAKKIRREYVETTTGIERDTVNSQSPTVHSIASDRLVV